MKQSLGKLILGVLALCASSWGGSFQWSVLEAPKELYVSQSGVVRYECAFDTSAADYTIEFKPKGAKEYGAKILTQHDRISNGKRIQTFDVLITPKEAGTITVNLDALIRHTTFASIENATIGRDNVKKYDFNDEKAMLPAVTITAKANSAALTGDIAFSVSVDRQSVRAYEPVHLSLMIKGSGNLDQFVPYELNISGVKVFAEPPQTTLTASTDGFSGEIRQEFALVAEKSFMIPPLSLSVMDTTKQKEKILTTEMIPIDVGEGYDIGNLLDPPDLSSYATLKRYALYAALIGFGVLLGEGFRRLWKHRPRRKPKYFWENAKNTKELILLLALSGEKHYEPIITSLETKAMSLSEAKKKLSTLTSVKEVI
ncbi:BatD family protein [Sulfuricurvum sp.]|uniref:BatD family protein n=1 Tax=Sulfuricurvum sp. TaxID=2025608 RepID=UPI003BB214B2